MNACPRESSGRYAGGLHERVRAFRRQIVLEELERHGGNVTATARCLGIRRQYYHRLLRWARSPEWRSLRWAHAPEAS